MIRSGYPDVESVMRRGDIFLPRGETRFLSARCTASKLWSGSPIPMSTTFVRRPGASLGRESRLGVVDLAEDLAGRQVAREPDGSRRAEHAPDRAADLRRHAERTFRATLHENRFDDVAVVQHENCLGRGVARTGLDP